jgi:hydrogenase maturation protease
MSGARIVLIGVGNAYREDDGAGLAVIEQLRAVLPEGIEIVPCEDEPSRLIDAWHGASAAVVVDAVSSGAVPGTLHRFDASEAAVPGRVFRSSTHAFGVGEAIELARALGKLPPRIVVYGIEGAGFGGGESLSSPVDAAVRHAADAVLADLTRLLNEEAPCTSTR